MFQKVLTSCVVIFICLPTFLFAQQPERCHIDQKMEMAFQLDPAYKKAIETEKPTPVGTQESLPTVITIPVHVIITHPPGQSVGTGVNFSMAHIESQIQVLNDDFRRTNSDAGNTPAVFPADDSMIEFCLASIDPDGNPTDGVTRYGTNQNLDNDEFAIKSATGWNRNTYMNLWVGDNLGGILGWAYLPTTTNLPNATLDGVVTASCTFGGAGFGTCSPYNLGRTTTHEVGHYLGLRHIWGGSGCNNDDGIADTPVQDSQNFGCPNHPSPSCNNGGDMFMNYMDYTNDNCMNSFSTGQGNRMQDILNTSRSSLLSAANTVCSASSVPLTMALLNQTNVLCNNGNDGTVSVQAAGGSGSFTYTLNGGTPQSSNTFTNLSAGVYTVEASDGGNSISIQVTITEPAPLIPLIVDQTDITCFGQTDGILNVGATGGTNATGSGYQYSLDGSAFSPNNIFTNISAGAHNLMVQDENNCQSSTTVVFIEPNLLVSSIANQTAIDCAGNNNGQVVIQSTGGTPTYLYSLNASPINTNNVFSNLSAGSYNLSTSDINGCESQLSFTLTEPTALTLGVSNQTNVDCFGDNSGLIEVNAQGGTTDYQYQMDNGGFQNTPVFSGLAAGNYSIEVKDANGCLETVTAQITAPAELTSSISQQTNAGCFGGNTGSVTIQSSGGTGNLTVTLNGNALTGSSVVFENLSAGVYPIIVTDENNCTINSSVEITQNANVEVLLQNAQNVICNGSSNGQIEVQTNGGTGNFTYYLNGVNQGNNNVFTNLSGGTYSIESIDDFGCSDMMTVEISEPTALNAQLVQQTNLNCFGENNGTVEVAASGGTGSIQFTLGNETNTSGIFQNLSAGNYTVNMLDENNCSTSLNVAVTQPTELTAQLANSTAVNCFGNNAGSLEITASGGVQNYQFNNGFETNTTGIFNNLSAGNYLVTITDGNNCQTTVASNISQPNELLANISTQQNINCFGENSGSVTLQANGGVGSITFTLNGNSNTTGTFSNLAGGNYSILIADENNCETSINVNIDEPTQLNLAIQSVTEASCAGQEGTIQVAANGGANNYQYTLGNTTNSTGFFDNLGGGIYSVEVEDNNGCTDAVQVEITEPTALSAAISQVQNVSCFGGNSGSVQLNAAGGVGNLTYTLGNQSNASGFFQNLNAGNYTVEVEDGNSCTSTIEVTIAQPNQLEIQATQILQIDCYEGSDGMVNLAATGGTGTVEFTLANQTNTSGVFENLAAGIYTFSSMDENGCTDELQIEITQPDEILTNIQSVINPSCANTSDGTLEITATGGTGNLTFTLGNETNATGIFQNIAAGNYSIIVMDGNNCVSEQTIEFSAPQAIAFESTAIQNINCNGAATGTIQVAANGGTGNLTFSIGNQSNSTGAFENLSAGIYEVMVMDENNCSLVSSVEVTESAAISLNVFDIQDANCFGENSGLISIGASGGNGDFEYSLGNQTNTTGDFSNLAAGNYSMEIIDGNNCSTDLDFTINQPAPLVPTASIAVPIDCFGNTGTIQLTAEGGIGNYNFSQNNNTNTSGVFENMTAGLYEFVVQDGNGCEELIEVNLTEPAEINLEILNITSVPCAGNPVGAATVQASNGTGSFIYEMNNETNTSGVFENLAAGIYDLTATDANGCVAEMMVTVTELNDIAIESSWSENVNCFGGNDGTINITALSASGDLTFAWDGNQNTTGVFENLAAGNYVVTLTDGNGCSELLSFDINEPDAVELEIVELTNVDCFGNSNGIANLNATGGTGDLTFELNGFMNNTGIFENLTAGNFTAEVTDANGCTQMQTIQITEPDAIETEIINLTSVDCFGASTGEVQMNATGGAGDFTYTLNGASNSTGVFENLPAGSFSIQIEDTNGCLVSQQIQINQPDELEISISNISHDLGNAEGSVSFDGNGGTPSFMYSLDGTNFQSSNSFENLAFGNYTGFIQDGNGCISQIPFIIEMETSVFSPNSGVTDLTILPNPFAENLFLKIELELAQDFELRMWTISGKSVFQKTIHLQKGKQQVNLDVENDLAAGSYILQVQNKMGEVAYFKLVKQR